MTNIITFPSRRRQPPRPTGTTILSPAAFLSEDERADDLEEYWTTIAERITRIANPTFNED